jgi:Group II intron, maturase-specific domain
MDTAETVNARLGAWLKERGLSMNTERTRIVRIDDGFDFLSFNIRRHRPKTGAKVLTRPSRDALHKIRRRIADELRAMRGHSPAEVIAKMNPIIRGQANYFRTRAASRCQSRVSAFGAAVPCCCATSATNGSCRAASSNSARTRPTASAARSVRKPAGPSKSAQSSTPGSTTFVTGSTC